MDEEENQHLDSKDCFNVLTTMFRKRSQKQKRPHFCLSKEHGSLEILSDQDDIHMTSMGNVVVNEFPMTEASLPPGSPISPRVKNFNQDMNRLALSRSDNPFINQQIERSNMLTIDFRSEDDNPTSPILSIGKKRSLSCEPPDTSSSADTNDLHRLLVRSPPPNFPQNVCQFAFTDGFTTTTTTTSDDDDDM